MPQDKYAALVAPNCKLDEQTANTICEWVRKGNYIGVSCQAAGIDHDTLNRWLKRAENGEEPFTEFAEELKKADARGEVEAVDMINELGQRSWQALMTRLERKYPDRWGQVQRIHQTHDLTPEAKQYLAALEASHARLDEAREGEYRMLPEKAASVDSGADKEG